MYNIYTRPSCIGEIVSLFICICSGNTLVSSHKISLPFSRPTVLSNTKPMPKYILKGSSVFKSDSGGLT